MRSFSKATHVATTAFNHSVFPPSLSIAEKREDRCLLNDSKTRKPKAVISFAESNLTLCFSVPPQQNKAATQELGKHMKGENEKNEVGCACHIQHKSAVGLAMKVTHFINNTAAIGGSPVRFDGWLCISGSSAVVEADRLWGQATISNTT